MGDRSTARRRLLLEHPLQGRAHLVEVRLGLGLDGDRQGRFGEDHLGQDQRPLLCGQRVARLGHAELGHGADLAGLQLAGRLLLLAVEQQQLADPLVLAPVGIPGVALAVERARVHPQVGQPADVRVGRGLEHPDQERARRIGLDRDLVARLGLAGDGRRLVGGRGQVADERIEQPAEPDVLGRAADEDRGQDRLLDALAEAGLQLGVADLLAVEVLGQHVVVGLGGGLEELVAATSHLRLQLGRDRDLGLLLAVPLPGRAMDEIDVAAERLGGPDREVEWRDLGAEGRPERVEDRRRIGVLAIRLVDEEAGRPSPRPTLGDGGLQAGLDAAGGIDHEQRAVAGRKAGHDLGHEVGIARGVDHGHDRAVVVERGHGRAERLAPLLLLGLVIERRGAVVDLAQPGDGPGLEQEVLGERRLAGAGMAGQDDASEMRQVNVLRRHAASPLVVR